MVLSGYKSSAISHMVIISLHISKQLQYFFTRPPSFWRSFVVLCINNVWGVTSSGAALLVSCYVIPFAIACVLPSYSFALILSDPARWALGR